MKPLIADLFRKMAKWKVAQKSFVWGLVHAPRLFPVKPLRVSTYWLVIVHPIPAYPVHLVILPKDGTEKWLDFVDPDGTKLFDFLQLTQSMIREYELEPAGYRLIMNGGPNQTFPMLHFHLVAGEPISNKTED